MKSLIKLVMIFIALTFVFSCENKIPSIKPEIKSITESVYASGNVKSYQQYNIYAGASGVIKEIKVKEGDIIKKGDVILTIKNLTATLNTDNAALLAQYNDYAQNIDKATQIKKEVEISVRKLKLDSSLMSRQNSLWEQGIGSKTDQEQKELNFLNSKATVENLRLKLKEVQRQLKFAAAQSKKSLEVTRSQLNDYTVISEINGKLYDLTKEIGEMVGPTTQIGVIGDDKNFKIELQLDEYDITSVRVGQTVIVRLDSYHNTVFEAKVDKIHPLMNDKTRTFTVEAFFVDKPEILYPNLSVEANIVLKKRDKILTIPTSYISDTKFVTLKDGSKKEIKIGLKDYQLTEVVGGIDANTEIILPK